ncbi:hypothetical protein BOX15_Mlig020696g1 [Macrostomum lignano]|uniref:Uncharacterized protein n=1 Tax=Macrostomum lignano TaxID=282301 RepID=A0A267DGY6_9PLAT|nr:hypothetical protein BOX15_Mlig020696g1 [Macrostomum lignano]
MYWRVGAHCILWTHGVDLRGRDLSNLPAIVQGSVAPQQQNQEPQQQNQQPQQQNQQPQQQNQQPQQQQQNQLQQQQHQAAAVIDRLDAAQLRHVLRILLEVPPVAQALVNEIAAVDAASADTSAAASADTPAATSADTSAAASADTPAAAAADTQAAASVANAAGEGGPGC